MKKYDLSAIMKRAWGLVKKYGMTISAGLKKAWNEVKEMAEDIIGKLTRNLEEMLYSDYHINAGVTREVITKNWQKNGNDRIYLSIRCYTLAGRYKGEYKCGYFDNIDKKYVVTRYDDVNAETKTYLG